MYTVIRFETSPEHKDSARQLGEKMNTIKFGVYEGLNYWKSGFACSLSTDDSWDVHKREIHEFFFNFGKQIHEAKEMGFSVTCDVAVNSEDRQSSQIFVLHNDVGFLDALASRGVALEVSMYP